MDELLLVGVGCIVLGGAILVFVIWTIASWLLRGDGDIDGWWHR